MDFRHILTSTEGRIPRSQWWAGVGILIVIVIAVTALINVLLGGVVTTAGGIATLILQLVLLYPYYAVSAKRFQDRNKPGSLALIIIGLSILQTLLTLFGLAGDPFDRGILDYILGAVMIVVGIWFLIELGVLKGTDGENQYGPDPLDRRG